MKINFLLCVLFQTLFFKTSLTQNIGVGTNIPLSLLHVKDGSVLFSGFNSFTSNPSKPPVTGKGTRTFWYVDKAAFRTGGVYNSSLFGFPDQDTLNFHNWDKDSIGIFSFAGGFNTKAKGDFSFAMGNQSFAYGSEAAAFGRNNIAKGNFSWASGSNNLASGMGSTALGNGVLASGNFALATGEFTSSIGNGSTAMGSNTEASGKYSTALGMRSIASGDYSTSMGDHTIASGDFSTAMGEYTTASGDYSSAMGKNTKAPGYASFAIGSNSIASGANSIAMGMNASTNNHTNSFCIAGAPGDVAATNSADNQMMMRFNNYTFWISSSNYAYLIPSSNGWAYTSDKNKKEKFQELDGETVLNKIAGIPFYSWNFKANDTRQYRHYGIMAQDFYRAFGKDDYGYIGNDTTVSPLDLLGVAYSGIKALEKRTEILQKENAQLVQEIISLKEMKVAVKKLQQSIEAINQHAAVKKTVR